MASGEQIEQLLRDLGRAFSEVMSSSQEVVVAVKRLQQQGYDLSLGVDHVKLPELNARVALSVKERRTSAVPPEASKNESASRPSAAQANALSAAGPPSGAGSFRIGTGDVALLRSLGIDATRKGKRKR